jgi:Protein of unknown function (DUF3037)
MNNTYPFTVLRVAPDRMRGERLNVGIAVFKPGSVHIFIEFNSARLRALDPNLLSIGWDTWAQETTAFLTKLKDSNQRHHWLMHACSPIFADKDFGYFEALSENDFDERVQEMLGRLIKKPGKTPDGTPRAKKASKLNGQLKNWFKHAGVFSNDQAELSNHRVVSNFPVNVSNDLYAEFAFKNGVVHVIETFDMRGYGKLTASIQKDAALKSIVLDQAKDALDATSKRIAIVAASDYSAMKPALNMITAYSDDVISMESAADKTRFSEFLATALHRNHALPEIS